MKASIARIQEPGGDPPYMRRIQKMKERVIRTRPSIDLENAKILTESFLETEGEPLVLRKAKAFREQCENKTVTIWEDELIVGCSGSKIRGGLLCADVCWSILDKELDTISGRPYDPFIVTEEEKAVFNDVIKPFWAGRSNYEKWLARIPSGVSDLRDASIIYVDRKAVRGPGELTAGYDWVLAEGINGIREKIADKLSTIDPTSLHGYDRSTYLQALLITCDGIIMLAKRYAEEAKRLAVREDDQGRKEELQKIAEICERVPAKPARTFWEALQSVYLYHICIFMEQNAASYNPGRMDQYLHPYYSADKKKSRITDDEAQELFDCLWVKFSEPCLFQDGKTAEFASGYNMFQNVCCGGILENGQDAVNELTYMMLQATMDVQLYQPSLSVRYNPGRNPNSFLRKIVDLMSLGTGFPAFHNDEVGIKMLLKKGVTLKEAYNWNPCGCVENNLMGKLKGYTAIADLNLASAIEFALLNGVYRLTGAQPASQTGDPRTFATYTEFSQAVKRHLAYLIREVAKANQVLDAVSDERPVPAASLSFRDCIENAQDYAWGGTKYSTGNGIIVDGVADFVNSLSAVKKLIYEDRQLHWDDLLSALDHDFEGYEKARQICLSAPKFGNDDPDVDEIATEMFCFIAEEVERYDSKYGKMTCGILPVTAHVPLGKVVGALPSGRKAWTTLTDGLSPTGGTDLSGPTAVLKSVSKIPHDMYVSGTLLNMKLDPSLLQDERGIRNMMAFLKGICDLGVYHIQFNVISEDTLLAAQKDPAKYRDLLVRVAGYTAYFVELGKDVQDEIIGRTTQFQANDQGDFSNDCRA